MSNIATYLAPVIANKIEIHGINIIKTSNMLYVWVATSSNLWPAGLTGIALANGETFPDPSVYGEFWAKYTDTVNMQLHARHFKG